MSQFPLRLANVTLHLKQLQVGDLNDLGKFALGAAFTGFMGPQDFDQPRIDRYLDNLRSTTGIANQYFDRNPYRRFAGDALLPRGRYYTIAAHDSGNDGGTLVRELRTYYNPLEAGIVQIFDTTDSRDRGIVSRFKLPGPSLVLVFLPVGRSPNPFAKRFTPTGRALLVQLPLKVGTRQLVDILDLRVPSTADAFARALREIEWNVKGTKTRAASLRPPLTRFRELLPAILEQSPGGNSFTNMIGTWLRQNGVRGLVFPSARVDSAVDVRNGAVSRDSGWNFVDYSEAPAPSVDMFVDAGMSWPKYVQFTPEGPHKDLTPITLAAVEISHEEAGVPQGSWAVAGLRRSCEGGWRALMLQAALDSFKERVPEESLKTVMGWIMSVFVQVFPRQEDADWESSLVPTKTAQAALEHLGGACKMLQEALMGVPEERQRLMSYVEHIRPIDATLASALEDHLHASAPI